MSDQDRILSAAEIGDAVERADRDNDGPASRASAAAGADAAPHPEPATEDAERRTIDIGDPDAVQYWSDRYRVTQAQLEEAVSAVGSEVHAVATYLRGQGSGD